MRTQLLAFALLLTTACTATESPLDDQRRLREGLALGLNATVIWNGLEGGFWAVRTDDGDLLDPHASLPADFRVNNLRVNVTATPVPDAACFHMAGTIVSITSIQRR